MCTPWKREPRETERREKHRRRQVIKIQVKGTVGKVNVNKTYFENSVLARSAGVQRAYVQPSCQVAMIKKFLKCNPVHGAQIHTQLHTDYVE